MKHSIAIMGWTVWDGRGKTPTGGAVVTYELTKRLSKYFDCEMIFETSDERIIGETVGRDAEFTKRFILRPSEFWRLEKDFVEKYDLIHIWDRAPIFTYRAYTKVFVPHCHTLHSAASMMDWARIASAFHVPRHDMIALGSESLAEALTRFWKVPVDIIPYGVDTQIFRPMDKDECRKHLNIPKDRFVLGYLGRPAKLDFILAYETLRKVKEATGRRDTMLLVAGGTRRVKPVHVTDDFVYLGYLDESDVPVMLNSCDVFFNPVAGVQEGFGLTVIEAMACGLPVVTTSWDGYKENVTESTGFLARTCWKDGDIWINQDDLVSACVRLVEDDNLRGEFGKRAKERANEKYKWEYCVEKYRSRFLTLIQKSPPERLPYEDAPKKIYIRTNDETRVYSLEEAFRKIDDLRLDFEGLYEGFVSNRKMPGGVWRKFTCRDNILNLPKYQRSMKDMLLTEETRLRNHFPNLVRALS